jgi:hypothetical protein
MGRVAEPGGDDMHLGSGQQQGRRVDMTQIMQPGVRQWAAGVLVVVGLISVVMSDETVSGWIGSPQTVRNT